MRLISAFVLGVAAIATPATAHNHGNDNAAHAESTTISQQRALEIAAEQGVARVREVELRRGVWKVEGYTAQGREIEVEIDPNTGAVLKRELY